MSAKSFEDLPARIQVAVRDAMPAGATCFDAFVHAPISALGNRSILGAFEQEGYAAAPAIISCCFAFEADESASVGLWHSCLLTTKQWALSQQPEARRERVALSVGLQK